MDLTSSIGPRQMLAARTLTAASVLAYELWTGQTASAPEPAVAG